MAIQSSNKWVETRILVATTAISISNRVIIITSLIVVKTIIRWVTHTITFNNHKIMVNLINLQIQHQVNNNNRIFRIIPNKWEKWSNTLKNFWVKSRMVMENQSWTHLIETGNTWVKTNKPWQIQQVAQDNYTIYTSHNKDSIQEHT
jgi:predicted PurR-regulated permease PerM